MIHSGLFSTIGDSTRHPEWCQIKNHWQGAWGKGHIASLDHLDAAHSRGGLALLFPAGDRADVAAVETALAHPRVSNLARISSHRGQSEGWLELLASGLTFDLTNLRPAKPQPIRHPRHVFGLPKDIDGLDWEACLLRPGPHLADAAAMAPVVRVMAMLASGLAQGLGARALCWQPAASWMDVTYFARIIEGWSTGGAFPALGLTGMDRLADGSVASDGLAFFAGQELRVEPRRGEPPAETVKLAVRLADRLVREGAMAVPERIAGPDGESLLAEPTADGSVVWLKRLA